MSEKPWLFLVNVMLPSDAESCPPSAPALLLSPSQGSLGIDPGPGSVLTYTAGLVARPLVVLLTCDNSLPHQLEGCLAFEGEGVSMEKTAACPLPIGRDTWVPTSSLLNF